MVNAQQLQTLAAGHQGTIVVGRDLMTFVI